MILAKSFIWLERALGYNSKPSIRKLTRRNFYAILAFAVILVYCLRIQEFKKCLCFEDMVSEKTNMENECLIDYIRAFKVVLPSNQPYNLTTRIDSYFGSFDSPDSTLSLIKEIDAPWVQALIAVELFVPKVDQRKFLECGGLDGVMYSTTLYLERFLNWTGVLIEPDDRYYSDMKRANRKAFGVHGCLSLEEHPTITPFKTSPVVHKTKGSNKRLINPSLGHIPNNNMRGVALQLQNLITGGVVQVQCFPVYSILRAVNITKIDLFVLDVEGVELEILQTLPFDSVEIAVFLIEVHGKTEQWINNTHKFPNSKKYLLWYFS